MITVRGAALGVAAVTASIMLALGRAPEIETVTKAEFYSSGMSTKAYEAQIAEIHKAQELQEGVKVRQKVLSLSAESQEALLKIAMAEAGGEDLEGKALVMNVVMNRIRDPEFPNTVIGVIFQKGQFSPIDDGRYWDMVPDEECEEALEMVTYGWDESRGATYFRTNVKESTWHDQNLIGLFVHGNHAFYKEQL